jgi:two-component system phosphate regulon sensor histidine kinase PhoR
MERQRNLPALGALLAVATAFLLLITGLGWPIVTTILLVWLGSLWLGTARPPDTISRAKPSPFSKDNLRAILELSASPLILTEKGTVVIANSAARKLIGNHILGQDARIAFRSPAAIELLNRPEGGARNVRNLTRLQDCWRMRRQVIDDQLAIIELSDRTAQEVVSRAHTDFVANASHELRTPLAAIIGYAETLREGGDELPRSMADRFLGIIEQEGKRMQELVSDLMSLSRIEAEKHDAPLTDLVLADLVARAASEAAGPERLHRLDFALDDRLIVQGDHLQLEQVARNLVDNAFAYGDQDQAVQVEVAQVDSRYVQIAVTDRGPGIAKEHLPHLTRRFYRTDPGRSRMSGGTGLGLAIVKHAVERHRGRLDISSVLGQGTRVSVRLPLKEVRTGASDELTDHGSALVE